MKKIFLSHCETDKAEVQKLYDLLCMGMGFEKREIFYSEEKSQLPIGEARVEEIKKELSEYGKVFCYITPNYLNSVFCISEMAAAWLFGKAVPVISHPQGYSVLKNTPLMNIPAYLCNSKEDIEKLYSILCGEGFAEPKISIFNNRLEKYFEELKKESFIEKDADNFYTASIDKARKVPLTYRCYKIRGLLKLEEAPVENETHWIFFRAGIYNDLKSGDTVRFSVGSTELKHFTDIGPARNIYPDDLQLV